MRRDPSVPYCDACGRAVRKTALLVGPDGQGLGPGCARKHGVRPVQQAAVKWQKPAGATLSAFRRPLGANARQMRGGREAQPPAPKWRPSPTALPGEVPLWDDDTEGDDSAQDSNPVRP